MSKIETAVQQYLRAGFPLDSKFGPYANIAARDAIPVEDRYPLMMVGVLDSDGNGTQTVYYLNGGLTNDKWVVFEATTAVSKGYNWTWGQGVDFNGTHLDFVIPVVEDGEIASVMSSILFVGSALQVGNFSIQSTNFQYDTIRILGTAGEKDPAIEVNLFYNRVGVGIPGGIPEAPMDGKQYARQDAAWTEVEAGGGSGTFNPVADITALKAIDTTDALIWFDKWALIVEAEGLWYRLDRDSVEAESLPEIVAPTTGVGRWYVVGGGGGDATEITFTSTVPNSWDIEPTVVSEALDELVQRVFGIEDAMAIGGGSAIENRYATIAAMLSDQAGQSDQGVQYVNDASTDATVDSGYAYYEYLGTTVGNLTDYRKLSEQESMDLDLSIYQTKTDNDLTTTSKQIDGAINELDAEIASIQGDQVALTIFKYSNTSGAL